MPSVCAGAFAAAMLFFCLAGGCARPAEEAAGAAGTTSPRYRFHRSLLREEGSAVASRLEILRDGNPLEIVFPPGADVWRDASARGYLVVSFMDRRFAAFGSTGLDFVDLETGRRVPLLRGMVWEAPDTPPDVLVGVRRVPREAPVLTGGLDTAYADAVFELFVLSFDPSSVRWVIVPIRTALWLPDANQPYLPGELPPLLVRVEGGVLFVARDFERTVWDEIRLADLVPW